MLLSTELLHHSHGLPAPALCKPPSYLTPVSSAQHLKPDGSHCKGINHLSPGLICGECRWHDSLLHSHVLSPPHAQDRTPLRARMLQRKLRATISQPLPPLQVLLFAGAPHLDTFLQARSELVPLQRGKPHCLQAQR